MTDKYPSVNAKNTPLCENKNTIDMASPKTALIKNEIKWSAPCEPAKDMKGNS